MTRAGDFSHIPALTMPGCNRSRQAGGLFWKRMQKSPNIVRSLCRISRLAAVYCLAIAVLSVAVTAPGQSWALKASDPATAAKTSTIDKLGVHEQPDRLEMSVEQALWTALAFEDVPKLKELLKYGADPNKPEKLSLMTPIMAAETETMAKILLEAGANPNLRDRTGRTALHHAVKMREAGSLVRLLGQAGADVNARANKDFSAETPLLSAIENYLEDKNRSETALAIRILIHLGADLDAADLSGRTPLAVAAANNQPALIRLLMELGADPARRMVNGRTPLDYAREANAEDAIKALDTITSKQMPAN